MRTTTLFLCLMLVATAFAAPNFQKNKLYRFACRKYGMGSIVPGKQHDQNYTLYYLSQEETTDDMFWKITLVKDGVYIIQNSVTSDYLTYDKDARSETERNVVFTKEIIEDSSYWSFSERGKFYVIHRADNPNDVFNVRAGSQMVGTYTSGGNSDNEQFTLYDKLGNQVTEGQQVIAGDPRNYISLTLNGKSPVYDAKNKQMMHTIPVQNMEGNDFIATLTFKSTEAAEGANYSLKIDNTPVVSGADYTFEQVTGSKKFQCTLLEDDEAILTFPLIFTSLPIVEINGSFNSSYSPGTIRVNQWFTTGVDTLYAAELRWRGATAMGKQKKSYAIKIKDDLNESKDVSFLGLRSDNNWILDAMAIDPARMRNRVGTDLWNDYSADPYFKDKEPKMINGTRGGLVEVLLNGQYNGMYCMTEKIDRKQLKLKKFDEKTATTQAKVNGVLYKSNQWSYSVLMGHEIGQKYYPMLHPKNFDNNRDTWDNWEMQYPDLADGEPIDWGPLYRSIDLVASTTSNSEFMDNVSSYFDLPVALDYYLFIELLLATDNHGKNMYLYSHNKNSNTKLGIAPWDLDGTWGRRWDGSKSYTRAEQDFIDFLWKYEHGEHTLFKRLKEVNYKHWSDSLAYRYAVLRQTSFHPDSLIARFESYKEQMDQSGAGQREIARWNNTDAGSLDFDTEIEYLRQWIQARVNYLDKQYDIKNINLNVGVQVDSDQAYFKASGGDGCLLIETTQPCVVPLFNANGQILKTLQLSPGVNRIEGISKGLYFMKGHKVLVR